MKEWFRIIWTTLKGVGAAWIAMRFGVDTEYLFKTLIIDNAALGVPWSIILQQSLIPHMLMCMAITIFGIRHAATEFMNAFDDIRMWFNEDFRDLRNFTKWCKRERRRLKKLEGC